MGWSKVGGGDLSWTNVSTFANGWSAYGAGYSTPAYRKDSNGVVHLKGLIQSGTIGSVAFNLPAGYRPPEHMLFACESSNGSSTFGVTDIQSTGDVTPKVGGNTFFSLDGISFYAN